MNHKVKMKNMLCAGLLFAMPAHLYGNELCEYFPDLCNELAEFEDSLVAETENYLAQQTGLESELESLLLELDEADIQNAQSSIDSMDQYEAELNSLQAQIDTASPEIRAYLRSEWDRLNDQYLLYRNNLVDDLNRQYEAFLRRVSNQFSSSFGSHRIATYNDHLDIGPPNALSQRFQSRVGVYLNGDQYAIPYTWSPYSFVDLAVVFIDGQEVTRWLYQGKLHHHFQNASLEVRAGQSEAENVRTPFYGVGLQGFNDELQFGLDYEVGELDDFFNYEKIQFAWVSQLTNFSHAMFTIGKTQFYESKSSNTGVSLFQTYDASLGVRLGLGELFDYSGLDLDFIYQLPSRSYIEYLDETYELEPGEELYTIGLTQTF